MPVVPGVVHFSDAGSIPAVSTNALRARLKLGTQRISGFHGQ